MSKVFLVTDASWVANEVRAGLSLGEWDIKEISDPRLTTSLVMEERPEAVIVDMQVGTMGGMAVIRGIRGEVDEADRPRTVLLLDRSADEFIARRAGDRSMRQRYEPRSHQNPGSPRRNSQPFVFSPQPTLTRAPGRSSTNLLRMS